MMNAIGDWWWRSFQEAQVSSGKIHLSSRVNHVLWRTCRLRLRQVDWLCGSVVRWFMMPPIVPKDTTNLRAQECFTYRVACGKYLLNECAHCTPETDYPSSLHVRTFNEFTIKPLRQRQWKITRSLALSFTHSLTGGQKHRQMFPPLSLVNVQNYWEQQIKCE